MTTQTVVKNRRLGPLCVRCPPFGYRGVLDVAMMVVVVVVVVSVEVWCGVGGAGSLSLSLMNGCTLFVLG